MSPAYIILLRVSVAIVLSVTCCSLSSTDEVTYLCAQAQESCKECIQAHPLCSWCSDSEAVNQQSSIRCRTVFENTNHCNNTIKPENEVNHIKDLNFSATTNPSLFEEESEIVQLKPQAASLKLRVGEPLKLNISFKKAIDYPLDLYYTMDLSYSMKDDLQSLQNLGINLVDEIRRNVTGNVNLGFGSFVDKVVLPYATNENEIFDTLCTGQCQPTFGFHHQLSLSSNGSLFKDSVATTIISANLDEPEGGFDALMQIAACTEIIGWRKDALHVVVLTTDAPSHSAGDGKLGGIYAANDKDCHLERHPQDSGVYVYTKSKAQDYPSAGQLREVFQENKIQAVFAVTDDVLEVYKGLKYVIPATVEKLENDSRNILSVISHAYDEIKSHFEMIIPEVPDNVEASFRISCPESSQWIENGLSCDNVEIGDQLTFQIELTAKQCPSDPSHVDRVQLTSNSISDVVKLTIEYHCECNCNTSTILNSDFCSKQGTLLCGACSCNPGRSGFHCQCETSASTSEMEQNCTDPNQQSQNDDTLCNNNGLCECGTCQSNCFSGYHGDFCQCQSTGCPRDEYGIECGGPLKGECVNCYEDGHCVCNSTGGWFLDQDSGTCSCNLDECKRADNDTQVCSGNGICNCKKCDCNDDSLYWAEKYCDKCVHPKCNPLNATCGSGEIQHCVECVYNQVDVERCTTVCHDRNIIVKTVKTIQDCSTCSIFEDGCHECSELNEDIFKSIDCSDAFTSDQCSTSYKIGWNYILHDYVILVQTRDVEVDCPQPIEPLYIILPVAGSILFIGIAVLVISKCIKNLNDKRKYEEFLREVNKGKSEMNINPIHEPATKRIVNPTFNPDPSD